MDSGLPPSSRRLWLERDQSSIVEKMGWLAEPDTEAGQIFGGHGWRLDELKDRPCLVLLGEPGAGKSTDLRHYAMDLEGSISRSDERVRWVDLSEFDNLEDLSAFFDRDPAVLEWVEGNHQLHLCLDALDEVRLLAKRAAGKLGQKLEELKPHLDRLRVRIVCRSADWPATGLETRLRSLFGSGLSALRIAPLSRPDVERAAQDAGLDPAAFLSEIHRVGVVHLAARPLTLNFLVGAATRDSGTLPSDRVALYRSGIESLLGYRGALRAELGELGSLSPAHLGWAAAWVAAATLFSGYARINVDPTGHSPHLGLSANELAVRLPLPEPTPGHLDVSPAQVREVLDTGLFEAAGTDSVRFGHRTYQEFLAADFLARTRIGTDQVLSLLSAFDDQHRRIVPQLRDLAVWFADLREDAGAKLIEMDPPIVLQSNFVQRHPEFREQLVHELLDQVGSERLTREWGWYEHYPKLRHARLGEQLSEALQSSASDSAKAIAVEIADSAGAEGAGAGLVAVALHTGIPLYIRARAIEALQTAGTQEDAEQVRLLVEDVASEESDEAADLHDATLRLLLQHGLLSLTDLLGRLAPGGSSIVGGPRDKLVDDLRRRIDATEVPHALHWLAEWDLRRPRADRRLADLASAIVDQALEQLHDESVRNAIGKLAGKAGSAHVALSHPLGETGPTEVAPLERDTRRAVIDAMVGWWARRPLKRARLWLPRDCRDFEDFEWLVTTAVTERGVRRPRIRLHLAKRVFDSTDAQHIQAVLRARAQHPAVDEVFSAWFEPIELNSELAQSLREEHWNAVVRQSRERHLRARGRAQRLAPALRSRAAAVVAGRPRAWRRLLHVMCIADDGSVEPLPIAWNRDIAATHGWVRFPELRPDVIAAARSRLARQPDDYAALFLLWRVDREHLTSASTDRWEVWASKLVQVGLPNHEGADRESASDLLREAYQRAPNVFCAAVEDRIEQVIRDHGGLPPLGDFLAIADDRLRDVVVQAVRPDHLAPDRLRDALEALFEAGIEEAESLAISSLPRLPENIPADADGRRRILALSSILHEHGSAQAWDTLQSLLMNDQFARDLVAEVAWIGGARSPGLLDALPATELMWWIRRLFELYPTDADPPRPRGAHTPTERELAGRYRDAVLLRLAGRGTPEVVDHLRSLDWELDDPHVSWAVHQALEAAREQGWQPIDPSQLLTLAVDSNRVLIRDAHELQLAILDSLRRLDDELQGEVPSASFLWNDPCEGGQRRPKDEEDLSDYVALHLRRDLGGRAVTPLREVQIRRSRGGTPGERTDVHVIATTLDDVGRHVDVATVIIEIKGCWYRNLISRMQTQLVERYLRDNRCRHGIFLVGWFDCPQWDQSDRRCVASRQQFESIEQLRHQINEEAERLTSSTNEAVEAFVLRCMLR